MESTTKASEARDKQRYVTANAFVKATEGKPRYIQYQQQLAIAPKASATPPPRASASNISGGEDTNISKINIG
jgi:hypothetical protein